MLHTCPIMPRQSPIMVPHWSADLGSTLRACTRGRPAAHTCCLASLLLWKAAPCLLPCLQGCGWRDGRSLATRWAFCRVRQMHGSQQQQHCQVLAGLLSAVLTTLCWSSAARSCRLWTWTALSSSSGGGGQAGSHRRGRSQCSQGAAVLRRALASTATQVKQVSHNAGSLRHAEVELQPLRC